MERIGIYYGSSTGTCEDIANRIAAKLGGAEVINASELSAENASQFDLLLLGSSTWGAGELQDDWYAACETLQSLDLGGKRIALFSVGDSESFGDTFCGALAPLYEAAAETGATIVGQVSADDYNYSDSEGVRDGLFLGLALDEVNEPDKTDARIDAWLAAIAV
ncbi:MAG: flavodoxin FldA [Bacteroidaceae bacterium]|nr:flavodoxin FldA [Bacteroidaceae bacterium]